VSDSSPFEVLRVHRDARGSVTEPLTPDLLPGQRNVHLVVSAPGVVRGNHLHRRGTEVLTVIGPALVRTRPEGGEAADVHVPPGDVYRFTFPPGVAHAIQNTGSDPGVLVAFNTEEHDPANPDVERAVLIE
jgi:dTDP-4-dehydrorhamnose 3,5-epimerase-like enzyme